MQTDSDNNLNMTWPYRDYDYVGYRYVNIQDEAHPCGEIMWYERDTKNAPTECLLCIEAEKEMYTKYAHPKAHSEAHSLASIYAEAVARKEKDTEEYMEYYIFHYGKEYKSLYKGLYNKYKQEYSAVVLERPYTQNDKICSYHLDSIQYHYEQKV
jgi:hypothetical protein